MISCVVWGDWFRAAVTMSAKIVLVYAMSSIRFEHRGTPSGRSARGILLEGVSPGSPLPNRSPKLNDASHGIRQRVPFPVLVCSTDRTPATRSPPAVLNRSWGIMSTAHTRAPGPPAVLNRSWRMSIVPPPQPIVEDEYRLNRTAGAKTRRGHSYRCPKRMAHNFHRSRC